jgi:hypothetical protein
MTRQIGGAHEGSLVWAARSLQPVETVGGALTHESACVHPFAFSISDRTYWNSFARSTLTLDGTTGADLRWEPYAASSAGQKLRGWIRFAYTGELGGLARRSRRERRLSRRRFPRLHRHFPHVETVLCIARAPSRGHLDRNSNRSCGVSSGGRLRPERGPPLQKRRNAPSERARGCPPTLVAEVTGDQLRRGLAGALRAEAEGPTRIEKRILV